VRKSELIQVEGIKKESKTKNIINSSKKYINQGSNRENDF